MPTDLDRLLTESLHERARAGSPIDPAAIMQVAAANGRRIRTRRRLATVVLAAAAVAGILVTGTLTPRRSDSNTPTPPDPRPTGSPEVTGNLGRLPDAVGQQGAGQRPDLVGTDPGVLHFSMDDLATDAASARSISKSGYEVSSVYGPDVRMLVTLTHTKKTFPLPDSMIKDLGAEMSEPVAGTVDGLPGTVSSSQDLGDGYRLFSVTWRPAGDLWANAEVQAVTADRALELVQKIRFDRVKRCATPFTIGQLPPGAALLSCEVDLQANRDGGGIFMFASLLIGDAKRRLEITGMDDLVNAGDYPRHLKAGPYRAEADPDGKTWTMLVKPVLFAAITRASKPPYTQKQVLDVLGSITMATGYNDPSTW